ncbi:MAG: UbiA family prenyltransferase [Cyanosarcina radialis HA8281-LM2]|jgi:protoheme IX farnesyltransferase|nr:UbiA family prenyltransferase [Cyanosarcina radialis HA8281-LM2]
MIRDDYAKVGIPMLPVVKGEVVTTKQIWIYTLILVPVTLLLVYPVGSLGIIYRMVAIALGAIFIQKAWQLKQAPNDRAKSRSLFKYSILYMMLLCAGIAIDSLPIIHELTSLLATNLHASISAIPYLPME